MLTCIETKDGIELTRPDIITVCNIFQESIAQFIVINGESDTPHQLLPFTGSDCSFGIFKLFFTFLSFFFVLFVCLFVCFVLFCFVYLFVSFFVFCLVYNFLNFVIFYLMYGRVSLVAMRCL